MGVKVKFYRGAWWIFIDHHGRRRSKKVGDQPTAFALRRNSGIGSAAAISIWRRGRFRCDLSPLQRGLADSGTTEPEGEHGPLLRGPSRAAHCAGARIAARLVLTPGGLPGARHRLSGEGVEGHNRARHRPDAQHDPVAGRGGRTCCRPIRRSASENTSAPRDDPEPPLIRSPRTNRPSSSRWRVNGSRTGIRGCSAGCGPGSGPASCWPCSGPTSIGGTASSRCSAISCAGS